MTDGFGAARVVAVFRTIASPRVRHPIGSRGNSMRWYVSDDRPGDRQLATARAAWMIALPSGARAALERRLDALARDGDGDALGQWDALKQSALRDTSKARAAARERLLDQERAARAHILAAAAVRIPLAATTPEGGASSSRRMNPERPTEERDGGAGESARALLTLSAATGKALLGNAPSDAALAEVDAAIAVAKHLAPVSMEGCHLSTFLSGLLRLRARGVRVDPDAVPVVLAAVKASAPTMSPDDLPFVLSALAKARAVNLPDVVDPEAELVVVAATEKTLRSMHLETEGKLHFLPVATHALARLAALGATVDRRTTRAVFESAEALAPEMSSHCVMQMLSAFARLFAIGGLADDDAAFGTATRALVNEAERLAPSMSANHTTETLTSVARLAALGADVDRASLRRVIAGMEHRAGSIRTPELDGIVHALRHARERGVYEGELTAFEREAAARSSPEADASTRSDADVVLRSVFFNLKDAWLDVLPSRARATLESRLREETSGRGRLETLRKLAAGDKTKARAAARRELLETADAALSLVSAARRNV